MKRLIGLQIGARYIFGQRGRQLARFFAPLFAIALSVMTIVLVFNVSNGMIRGIITKFVETGIYHVRASAERVYAGVDLAAARERLLADPFIERVGFEYNAVALLAANGFRQGVSVRALSAHIWRDDPAFREHISVEQGELRLTEPSDIMIGSYLAQQMGVAVGDQVQIISLDRLEQVVIPRISSYRVQGIFSAGYRALDRMWVLLPFEHARGQLAASTLRTVVGIKVADPFSLSNPLIRGRASAQAERALQGVYRKLRDSFTVRTWFEFRAGQFLSFRSTKNILLFIMLLIVAVAMIHLVSTLNTLIVEKRADIAYLKSIGTSDSVIRTTFVSCGFYIGGGGAAVGVMLGLFASIHVNGLLRVVEIVITRFQQLVGVRYGIHLALLRREFYLEQIPVSISLSGVATIFCVTLLFAIGAALSPAQRSLRVNPLQILSDTPR